MPNEEAPSTEVDDTISASTLASTVSSYLSEISRQQSGLAGENETVERRLQYPIHVQILPVILPREPTMEELLRQAAGTSDLQNVTEIHLRCISDNYPLQRIPMFIPKLRKLVLDGSALWSLRDLGTDLKYVRHLDVSSCGLKSLDGTSGFYDLEELVANDNYISALGPCMKLRRLRKLSLIGNKIADFENIAYLAICEKLRILDFTDNSITQFEGYREIIKQDFPFVTVLDGEAFTGGTVDFDAELSATSDCKSETSSEGSRVNLTFEANPFPNSRPMTAVAEIAHIDIVDRPMTAGIWSDDFSFKKNQSTTAGIQILQLSFGAPIFGSIVNFSRKLHRHRTSWGGSTSCSSISSSSESSYTRDFPNRLPQVVVDLELGVIGERMARSEPTRDVDDDGDDEESDNLLQQARRWRQRSQSNRESSAH